MEEASQCRVEIYLGSYIQIGLEREGSQGSNWYEQWVGFGGFVGDEVEDAACGTLHAYPS